MIYVKLHGRLGNILFCLATAATVAKQNNDNFTAFCHTDYLLNSNNDITIWEYIQDLKANIFKNIEFMEHPPSSKNFFKQKDFSFEKINYQKDMTLVGSFQSFKFFDKKIAYNLFKTPPKTKKIILKNLGNNINKKLVSIHVRRGDFCEIPHKFPVCSLAYYKEAMRKIGLNRNFVIISNDMTWCKKVFKGSNIYFFESNDQLADLFVHQYCEDHIISNSTFSWWGAFLNKKPNKNVIYPTNWFGISRETKIHNTKDLFPDSWIPLNNRMNLNFFIKSIILYLFEELSLIKRKIKI